MSSIPLLTTSTSPISSLKTTLAKRAERKSSQTAHLATLSATNASRIATLQAHTCFCQTSDWQGRGCEAHGGAPGYRYQRGREEGALVVGDGEGVPRAPGPMGAEEVRRINEERRGRAGGWANWVLRRGR